VQFVTERIRRIIAPKRAAITPMSICNAGIFWGVNEYLRLEQSMWLQSANRDATNFFRHCVRSLPSGDWVLITDTTPMASTRVNFFLSVKDVISASESNSGILIYVACHGFQVNGELVLALKDFHPRVAEVSGVRFSELMSLLGVFGQQHKFCVVLDCCRNGDSSLNDMAEIPENVCVLFSCESGTSSLEHASGGAFTTDLLRVLSSPPPSYALEPGYDLELLKELIVPRGSQIVQCLGVPQCSFPWEDNNARHASEMDLSVTCANANCLDEVKTHCNALDLAISVERSDSDDSSECRMTFDRSHNVLALIYSTGTVMQKSPRSVVEISLQFDGGYSYLLLKDLSSQFDGFATETRPGDYCVIVRHSLPYGDLFASISAYKTENTTTVRFTLQNEAQQYVPLDEGWQLIERLACSVIRLSEDYILELCDESNK